MSVAVKLAQKHTAAATETLAEVMQDTAAPYATRVAAAVALLDLAQGKVARDNEPVSATTEASLLSGVVETPQTLH